MTDYGIFLKTHPSGITLTLVLPRADSNLNMSLAAKKTDMGRGYRYLSSLP